MLLLRNILFILLFLLGTARLMGQSISLSADTTQNCDSILVHFTGTPDLAGKTLQTYIWHFGVGALVSNTSTTATKMYNVPGIYHVILEMKISGDDQSYTDTVQIFVRPHPNANFFVADTFQLGRLTYRFLSGKAPSDTIVYHYTWTLNPDSASGYTRIHSHANYVTGSTKRDTLIYAFSHSGTDIMRLQVTDYFGCTDVYQQRFFVSEALVVPPVFTPNGDGVNDFFIVQTNGRTVFSFKVFSITGQLIYKSESSSIMWDGRMTTGSAAAPGTYLYIIESIGGEPVKKQSGFFMLLKEK